jgi:hypothetical protein
MRFIRPDLNLNLKLKLNGKTRLNTCTAKPNPLAFVETRLFLMVCYAATPNPLV